VGMFVWLNDDYHELKDNMYVLVAGSVTNVSCDEKEI
jgi:hypothetical protein